MEEDRNEESQEEAKDFSGRVAGGLIGLAIGLFIASSMTIRTSLWILWLWAIVPIVLPPIGWWLGRKLPKISILVIFLLVILSPVALVGPIKVQQIRYTKIVDQLSTFPGAELQELNIRLFGTDAYPGFTVQFTTDADARNVVKFYRESLNKSGWEMVEVSIDESRSLAVAEFELPGRYRLFLQRKDDWFAFSVREMNLSYDPPKIDTKQAIKNLK